MVLLDGYTHYCLGIGKQQVDSFCLQAGITPIQFNELIEITRSSKNPKDAVINFLALERFYKTKTIIITPEMKPRLLDLGKRRNENKPQYSTEKSMFTDEESHQLGVFGEYAACEYFGLEMNWEIYGTKGDDKFDIKFPNGTTGAVKFNHYWKGHAFIKYYTIDTRTFLRDLQATYFIHTYGHCRNKFCDCKKLLKNKDPVTINIGGWIQREKFLKLKQIKDFGNGLRHFVRFSYLEPMVDLVTKHHVLAAKQYG